MSFGLLGPAISDARPSIDGDREMTSEVPPNVANPRETSASQVVPASCLARPPGVSAPSLYLCSFVCECGFCLRRHRAWFYRARYRRRPFAVINLNSLNSTSSRCGMLLVATRGSAETKLTEFSQQYTDVRKIFTPLWAPQTSRLCRHRFAGFRPTTEPSGRQGIKANPQPRRLEGPQQKSMISVMLMRDGVSAGRYGIRDNNSHVTQPRALRERVSVACFPPNNTL